jgi:glutamate-ammonia-ligase adenylyltransferase
MQQFKRPGMAQFVMLGLLSRLSNTSSDGSSLDLSAFRERDRARSDMKRIAARVPGVLLEDLLQLLAESPDPDQSLNLLERLMAQGDEQLLHLLSRNPTLLHYIILIFGHSYWLGETVLHNTDLLERLLRDKRLERSLTREDYQDSLARFCAQCPNTDVAPLLSRFKKREYVRILLRDALGVATLAEATQEISALADAIIGRALEEAEEQMRARHRGPQRQRSESPLAVLALGKLGGNELNYSSDVDLLCIYGEDEREKDPSPREHFVRQTQLLTEILSQATPEGAPFRIDLRLRPQGSEGEPVVALEQSLHYYSHVARDWELQALIKARYCAGDEALAREFIRGIQRQVYKEAIHFAAIETALHSREKMGARRRRLAAASRTPATLDVKLDRGGIRDIEFLAQCLQRVYGGDEPWLRSGGTLFSLQKLHDKGHLSGKDFQELTQAYELLRRVEHALQLRRGQQVHHLPQAAAEVRTVERAVRRSVDGDKPEAFLSELRTRMARVAEIYDRVIHSERHSQQQREEGIAADALRAPAATMREMSFAQVMERVAVDSRELRDVIARTHLGLHARRNLHRFLSSALTSGERYTPLVERPQAVGRALALFETSDYLTDILVRHPDAVLVLDSLPGVSGGTPAPAEDMLLPAGKVRDPGLALAQLRRDFRKCGFAVGAQDVLFPRAAFASMREITRLGDAAIRHALKIVNGERSLAVFALGRLGTEEFDISSDADLLFVRAPEADEEEARLDAERLVHALSAYTRDGTIFAVDARLRPRGTAGELVVSPAPVERYLAEEAQAWEALSYTKLRFVAGREDLAPLVLTNAWHQIVKIGARPEFPEAVVEMRERLEKANRYPHSFKLARGGFYDIDFIASYLMLREASLAQGNTLNRLQHLREMNFLDELTFARLHDAALLFRTADHVIRLVTGRARPELPEAEHARKSVQLWTNRILGCPEGEDLQIRLADTSESVRSTFLGVMERY